MKSEKRKWLEEKQDLLKVAKKELVSVYEEGYIGKRVYQYTLKDGTKVMKDQITKNGENGDAVVIIPVTKNHEFVMVLESRPNTEEEVAISFPAGMIDKGEEPKEAAIRELLEETGYTSDTFEFQEWHYQDQGCSKAKITTFLALNARLVDTPHLDEDERIEVVLMSEEEVWELLKSDKLNSANSKIALYTYQLKKERRI